ncbi:TPA_exp: putative RING finger domain protein [Trichophyton benhamiae CBS 112371]|nr:TPA_exp: putative RING finger domain protein [Trichophyton benhamiae CBS 112371]
MNSGPSRQTIHARQPRKRYHEETSRPHSDGESQAPRSRRGESSSSVDTPGALSSSSTSSSSNNDVSGSRPRLPPLPPFPRTRYPGDGFDFRRPVMSTGVPTRSRTLRPSSQEDVIDLTQDSDPIIQPALTPGAQEVEPVLNRASRGPRFGRNIMVDVVDLEDDSASEHQPQEQQQQQQQQRHQQRHQPRQPSSPEVQFLGSLVRSGASHTTERSGSNTPQSLFARRSNISTVFRDLTSELDPFAIQLDYSTTGFVGGGSAPRTEPSYEPPPPPPDGFTRTVTEDKEAICPNCERELGTGDELGKQLWVSRACGHVYCGTCAKNRALSSRAKKPDPPPDPKTKPFAKCVVADCGKPVSQPKAMLQIYL